jgi:phenylacetate-coenzyme A ligase PaaK-like adenylate-forming protein
MSSARCIIFRKLSEFRANARMTRQQFKAMKLDKFRRLVRHAQQSSPYYAQLIRERGIEVDQCTPSDFPHLTKAILMAQFDRIVTDRRLTKQGVADFLTRSQDPTDLLLNEFRVIHTSGSSGEVGYFVYSRADWARGSAQLARQRRRRTDLPRRVRFRRLRLAYYGAIGGHFAGITMLRAATQGVARFFVKTAFYEVNNPLPETVAALTEFRPDVLAGYTGALTILAAKQREGALRISPVSIGTAGESLSATDKKTLEEAFGCEVSNGYGSSEHLMMGFALPGGASMLLRDDDLIYEPFEDHTLVSNLFNYTLPLIRYRMADVLRPVVRKSDPDSPYMEIESLVGRTEMMSRFLNDDGIEDFISPHTINEIFVAGVSRFQMQLTGSMSFRFAVCLDPALPADARIDVIRAMKSRLSDILQQKKMSNVRFTVDVVDDIPVNPRTRKFQLIVADGGVGQN